MQTVYKIQRWDLTTALSGCKMGSIPCLRFVSAKGSEKSKVDVMMYTAEQAEPLAFCD